MKLIVKIAFFILSVSILTACIDDDSFSTSPSNILTFSTDTVSMDTVFSRVPSSTKKFWVYNRSGDGIRCVNVRQANGNQTGFRVNVDGVYLSPSAGFQTSDVEIRKNDSICVFVELTSPENGREGPQWHEDELVFMLESGVEQRVNLCAYTWDAEMWRDVKISEDKRIENTGKPIIVYGGITVDSLATLEIDAGTVMYFHNDAGIDVYGKLKLSGEPGNNVVLRCDRTDKMFDYLPYDMVSGMWQGIKLHSSSYGNEFDYADIHGTFDGIVCESSDVERTKLRLDNSTVHNCQGYGLRTVNCKVDVNNCQITNTLGDCVSVCGGSVSIVNCTVAQFYPFDARRGAALSFTNSDGDNDYPLLRMDCINTIVTGYADDVVFGSNVEDETVPYNYSFINCVLRTEKPTEDKENIINVIWEGAGRDDSKDINVDDIIEGEKHFRLVDGDRQRYDFHLAEGSTAIGNANADYLSPVDRDGTPRDGRNDIGCYVFINEEE
ncbi:right-handed parallel beta-helix repeat-containing protein [Xylanibacter caecicola]|uniref:right-handed parallel beta-helix repeat-containing protein n=1 Tax=Xylanibacter caecicola TaxID=2736294 RepID=UPI002590E148|nr:right-handed parallel beta-helix repeat-containing protein [Xylanibacter caecicola]